MGLQLGELTTVDAVMPAAGACPARRMPLLTVACTCGPGVQGPLVSIPQFYFPTQSSNAGQGSDPATRDFLQRAEAAYKTDGGAAGLGQKAFVKMMQEVGAMGERRGVAVQARRSEGLINRGEEDVTGFPA